MIEFFLHLYYEIVAAEIVPSRDQMSSMLAKSFVRRSLVNPIRRSKKFTDQTANLTPVNAFDASLLERRAICWTYYYVALRLRNRC